MKNYSKFSYICIFLSVIIIYIINIKYIYNFFNFYDLFINFYNLIFNSKIFSPRIAYADDSSWSLSTETKVALGVGIGVCIGIGCVKLYDKFSKSLDSEFGTQLPNSTIKVNRGILDAQTYPTVAAERVTTGTQTEAASTALEGLLVDDTIDAAPQSIVVAPLSDANDANNAAEFVSTQVSLHKEILYAVHQQKDLNLSTLTPDQATWLHDILYTSLNFLNYNQVAAYYDLVASCSDFWGENRAGVTREALFQRINTSNFTIFNDFIYSTTLSIYNLQNKLNEVLGNGQQVKDASGVPGVENLENMEDVEFYLTRYFDLMGHLAFIRSKSELHLKFFLEFLVCRELYYPKDFGLHLKLSLCRVSLFTGQPMDKVKVNEYIRSHQFFESVEQWFQTKSSITAIARNIDVDVNRDMYIQVYTQLYGRESEVSQLLANSDLIKSMLITAGYGILS